MLGLPFRYAQLIASFAQFLPVRMRHNGDALLEQYDYLSSGGCVGHTPGIKFAA